MWDPLESVAERILPLPWYALAGIGLLGFAVTPGGRKRLRSAGVKVTAAAMGVADMLRRSTRSLGSEVNGFLDEARRESQKMRQNKQIHEDVAASPGDEPLPEES